MISLGPRSVLAGGLLGILGLLAGCAGSASPDSAGPGSAGSGPASPSPVVTVPPSATPGVSAGALPRITLRRTGGFAGVFQTLVVEPDGRWTWTAVQGDPNAGAATQRGQLGSAQRAELARLAVAPALAVEASRRLGPPKCADGFLYSLAAGSLTVVWGDCGAASPPAAVALTDYLATVTPL